MVGPDQRVPAGLEARRLELEAERVQLIRTLLEQRRRNPVPEVMDVRLRPRLPQRSGYSFQQLEVGRAQARTSAGGLVGSPENGLGLFGALSPGL